MDERALEAACKAVNAQGAMLGVVREAIAAYREASGEASVITAALAVLKAVDFNHETRETPLKYTVPWLEIVALRKALHGFRIFASDAVPPGSMLVINPETLRRTLSFEALIGRMDVTEEPAPPTVAELLAGFDAKIEAVIEGEARRARMLRREQAANAMIDNEFLYRKSCREVLGRYPPDAEMFRPGDPEKGGAGMVARWVDQLRRFDRGW